MQASCICPWRLHLCDFLSQRRLSVRLKFKTSCIRHQRQHNEPCSRP